MRIAPVVAVLLAVAAAQGHAAELRRLSRERFLDKCRGAWAGQMIGVCYGAPYEFRSNGRPITKALEPWRPERVEGAIGQDDCYVEMTFLQAIEKHGLDITYEQAGRAFAASQYPLWHANRYGRLNIRRGIMPPLSGHPEYNRHADDIDFQIEADLFGILCPGLPQESNRLCDIFGHIMNYGDGVYGGMFVAGMYAAAYFEDHDVRKVIDAGLACIPAESEYHKCITDVIRLYEKHRTDWLAAWKEIEARWQDDIDCVPGNPFNIDAKLNGAYIVMGLLYGEGDFLRTMEISTRCGQDADCNPSNAAGVLGCMKGFKGIGEEFTSGIAKIADTKFLHTDYSFNTLIPACQKVTEQIIVRTGGKIDDEGYLIAVQKPKAAPLEQWTDQKKLLSQPIPQSDLDAWSPGWKVLACGTELEPAVMEEYGGRKDVLKTHPVSRTEAAVLEGTLDVPAGAKNPKLRLHVSSEKKGDFLLRVLMEGRPALEEVVETNGEWREVRVPLGAGSRVRVRIENAPHGAWMMESMYLATPEVVSE